jgi:hypothetical protein
MVPDRVAHVMRWMAGFETPALVALPRYGTSVPLRDVSLRQSRRQVQRLSLQQEDLLQESLACIEGGLYRAAHVTAWQAFIDLVSEALVTDRATEMYRLRPDIYQVTATEVRERLPEYDLITVAREVGLLTMAATKRSYGLLSMRNDCAHPSSYRPGLTDALGYVSELIASMTDLQTSRTP